MRIYYEADCVLCAMCHVRHFRLNTKKGRNNAVFPRSGSAVHSCSLKGSCRNNKMA